MKIECPRCGAGVEIIYYSEICWDCGYLVRCKVTLDTVVKKKELEDGRIDGCSD